MEPTSERPALWYGTPDAPAPPAEAAPGAELSLTVAVRPVSFSDAVNVYYSVDGRPERMLRAFLERRDHATGTGYFRATFPFVAPGSCVKYRPTLVSLGRSIEAGDRESPGSFCVEQPQPADSGPGTDTPPATGPRFAYRAQFIARASIPIEKRPEVIGVTPDGLRVDFYVRGGTLIGPRIDAQFTHHGGDWMRIRPDGIGIADIHATLQTSTGHRILAQYSGVLELGPDGYDKAIRGVYPPSPPASVTPRFLTGAREYEWLNRLQCFGTGFFDTEALVLNYDMYTIQPRMP